MLWKTLLLILMCCVIVVAFLLPPPQSQMGEVSRIFYFHVPVAWVAVLAFLISFMFSISYLRRRELIYDIKASASARLGLLFAILATISGSIFAKSTWGSFWNWDPRETSVFILLLIYGAYFALRSAVDQPERRAALSGVYAILAFITVPFLVSVIDVGFRIQMSTPVLTTFLASLLGFTLLFIWIYKLDCQISRISFEEMEE
jgi:heme exporter protein C